MRREERSERYQRARIVAGLLYDMLNDQGNDPRPYDVRGHGDGHCGIARVLMGGPSRFLVDPKSSSDLQLSSHPQTEIILVV
jgi:hypothetical protein